MVVFAGCVLCLVCLPPVNMQSPLPACRKMVLIERQQFLGKKKE